MEVTEIEPRWLCQERLAGPAAAALQRAEACKSIADHIAVPMVAEHCTRLLLGGELLSAAGCARPWDAVLFTEQAVMCRARCRASGEEHQVLGHRSIPCLWSALPPPVLD